MHTLVKNRLKNLNFSSKMLNFIIIIIVLVIFIITRSVFLSLNAKVTLLWPEIRKRQNLQMSPHPGSDWDPELDPSST